MDMTIPQMVSVVLGAVICLGSCGVFCSKRTRRFRALVWLGLGLSMIYAGFRPQIIELLGEDGTALRLRLVVALLSFIMLSVTLEAIRVSRMQERYAFLWLATGVVLFLGALSPLMAVWGQQITGMSYGAIVVVVCFAFIIFVLFHVSVTLSRLQANVAELVRSLALVEERVRQLESARAANTTGQPVLHQKDSSGRPGEGQA
jgi:hypothetical protein